MQQSAKDRATTFARATLRQASVLIREAGKLARLVWGEIIDAFWQEDEPAMRMEARACQVPSSWRSLRAVMDYHHRLIFGGDPKRYRHFVDYAVHRWGGKLPQEGLRVLCLGVTPPPALEQMLRQTCVSCNITTIDPSAALVKEAAAFINADAGQAISYLNLDPEHAPLPQGPFHIIISHNNLHRFAELEFIFDQIAGVLDPIGIFVALEYTGPNRLQYTDEQLHLANAMLQLLPEHLRIGFDQNPLPELMRPDLGGMLRSAPDCAVRSEDLLGVMRVKLKVLEHVPLGGALLAPLLNGISGNFRKIDQQAQELLEAVITIESIMLKTNLLPSNYGFMVARKPAAI